MAVRIPIVTVFDSKGLKQAQYALNKVRGNFQNLGRNFAIAGAAFAGAAAVITKSAQALARIESINAQTAQTIKSMGNAANVSAEQVADLANNLEAMTATEAESIQEGANLLLTFRNITNQLGAGNDIFNQTTAIMVDMGRALNEGAASSAIRLGKALNDPIRGLTALRKVGVGFTEEQENQIKILQESGDIMGAQKIILAELQAQFGGSGAAFAETFSGQVELLNHELGALGEEATLVVMPALRTMVEELRKLAPEIGTKLSAAIASVDWEKFTKAIVDTITFLVTHAETIGKVVTALFLLNTAYNLGRVAMGLYTAATLITKTTLEATTTSANLLRTALFLGGVTIAVGSVISEYRRLKEVIKETNSEVSRFNEESLAITGAAAKLNPVNTIWQNITKSILDAITANRTFRNESGTTVRPTIGTGFSGADVKNWRSTLPSEMPDLSSITGASGAAGTKKLSLGQQLKREATIVKKQAKLIGAGVSQGLADRLTSGATPIKRANKAIAAITKNNGKLTKNLKKMEKNLRAATKGVSDSAADNSQAIVDTSVEDALREKERVYKSFSDSVANTFAGIKDRILDAFSLPELGGSTDSIIRNMDKLLTRVKAFSANITKLSSMGLDPKLLQQVINAGPIAGAKLAANLVAGGVGGLTAINKGYAELGGLAGEIGMTGTQATFGTQAQQNIYNLTVNGGLDSSASIGKAVVDAIKAYERTSGVVFQGA
jgi:uncharacterized protein YdbL (DUF1318 family)